MRGNAVDRRNEGICCNLPCAGITLVRFYGFDLSWPWVYEHIIVKPRGKHPGKLMASKLIRSQGKIKIEYFKKTVTFLS